MYNISESHVNKSEWSQICHIVTEFIRTDIYRIYRLFLIESKVNVDNFVTIFTPHYFKPIKMSFGPNCENNKVNKILRSCSVRVDRSSEIPIAQSSTFRLQSAATYRAILREIYRSCRPSPSALRGGLLQEK